MAMGCCCSSGLEAQAPLADCLEARYFRAPLIMASVLGSTVTESFEAGGSAGAARVEKANRSITPKGLCIALSLFAVLIGEVSQILFDQRAILLRVFFGLRLLNGRAIALGQPSKLAGAGRISPRTISTPGAIPIALPASALGTGRTLALPFALLPLPLAFSLLALSLPLAICRHGGFRV